MLKINTLSFLFLNKLKFFFKIIFYKITNKTERSRIRTYVRYYLIDLQSITFSHSVILSF